MTTSRSTRARSLKEHVFLTRSERTTLSAMLLILLIGACARYFYLKKQAPSAYDSPLSMEPAEEPVKATPGGTG